MRCPRCDREEGDATRFCSGCGAPLRLRDEGPARPLEVPVALDRRGPRAGATARTGAPPPLPPAAAEPASLAADAGGFAAELADLERSQWDLGEVAAAAARVAAEPVGLLELLSPPPDEREGARTAAGSAPDEALAAAPAGRAEPGAREVHVVRAEPWRRAAAWAIDALPFAAGIGALARTFLAAAVASLPAPPAGVDGALDLLARERVAVLSLLGALAIGLAVYTWLAHALAGATLGKWLLGIRVVGPDGARPSPARSAARSALALGSAALLGLGFLLALFTRSGRALHDLVARTWVVKAP